MRLLAASEDDTDHYDDLLELELLPTIAKGHIIVKNEKFLCVKPVKGDRKNKRPFFMS